MGGSNGYVDRNQESSMATSGRGVALAESIEHERQEVGLDAMAGIADREFHVARDFAQHDLDLAAPRREFECVGQ